MTMTEPRFPVQVIRGVPVVIAPQEIDITNADRLRTALLHAAARPGAAFVVDMTRTRFCDSAGLHALLGAHKRARAEGRQCDTSVRAACGLGGAPALPLGSPSRCFSLGGGDTLGTPAGALILLGKNGIKPFLQQGLDVVRERPAQGGFEPSAFLC